MAKIIGLPDGTEGEFPDTMSDEEISSILRKQFPPTQAEQAPTQPLSGNRPAPVEELGMVDKALASLPNWLLTGNKQMRGVAQGAADPSIGAAQLVGNVLGQGDKINPWVREKEAEYQKQRGDTGFDTARLAGNVISPMNVLPASKLPVVTSLGGRALQGAAIGGGSGAMSPVSDDDYWKEKALQTGVGVAAGAALPAAVSGSSRLISPKGTPDTLALAKEGIRLTPGQALGGVAKSLEDKATSLPLIGDAIQYSRREGIEDLNKALYQRVLDNFGEALPKGMKAGQEALGYIHKKASDAYENVFNKGMLEASPQSGAPSYIDKLASLRQAVDYLPDAYVKKYDKIMEGFFNHATPQGNLSGESLNKAMKYVRGQADRLKNTTDTFGQDLHDALKQVNSELLNAVETQNPELSQALSSARGGWHDYAILRDAASSGSARKDGIITPAALMNSVANTSKKLHGQAAGKAQISEGTARMQDLAGAASRILPSNYPDSGTMGRLALGAGVSGAGAALAPAWLAGAGVASLPYLPGGRQLVSKVLSPRPSLEPAALALRDMSPLLAAGIPKPQLGE